MVVIIIIKAQSTDSRSRGGGIYICVLGKQDKKDLAYLLYVAYHTYSIFFLGGGARNYVTRLGTYQ